jgi:hypothetical protein
MNTTGDDEPQGGQETWSPAESPTLEQIVARGKGTSLRIRLRRLIAQRGVGRA